MEAANQRVQARQCPMALQGEKWTPILPETLTPTVSPPHPPNSTSNLPPSMPPQPHFHPQPRSPTVAAKFHHSPTAQNSSQPLPTMSSKPPSSPQPASKSSRPSPGPAVAQAAHQHPPAAAPRAQHPYCREKR